MEPGEYIIYSKVRREPGKIYSYVISAYGDENVIFSEVGKESLRNFKEEVIYDMAKV